MKKRSILIVVLVVVLVAIVLAVVFSGQQGAAVNKDALAESKAKLAAIYDSMEDRPQGDYASYIASVPEKRYAGPELYFPAEEVAYLSEIDDDTASVTVNAPEDGLYAIAFEYRPEGNNVLQTVLAATVDGKACYEEMTALQANNVWESDGFPLDRYGNECVTMPVRNNETWQSAYLRPVTGRYTEPMLVYLAAGDHEVAFSCAESAISFRGVRLCPVPEISQPKLAEATGTQMILIEAEQIQRRNNPNIRTAAAYNTDLTPYSNNKKVQNYIEDASFRYGGSLVEYDFEVPEDGYYNVKLAYRQGDKDGFTVFRHIYIDGEIPNTDYADVPFAFTRAFVDNVLESPLYLTKGSHRLGIEVSLEHTRLAIMILNQITKEMNDLTLEISRITGGNTDKYRDFVLSDFGIDAETKLLYWAELLEETHGALELLKSVEGKCGEIEPIQVAAKLLRILAEKPNELPKRLNEFSRGTVSSSSSAAASVSVMQYLINVTESLQFSQLGLDKIILYQDEAKLPEKKDALAAIGDDIGRFVTSFGEQEYTPAYDGQEGEALQVWVNRPRQYLEIMQNLVDTRFTPETGIKVDLSIVPDQYKLVLANASGKAPDAALSLAAGGVYDLAVRGALTDMRQFDNFKEVGNRFSPGMLIPGVLGNGVYAIPETFNFWVMFYRSDILDSLGLAVPDTMQDVRDMLPQLRRMGMNFNSHVSNFVVKPFAATSPFIFQAGGSIYEEGTGLSALDTQEAIEGMTTLTDNYNIYNMQFLITSFYQYFRDGRTPIGVSDYGAFNLLTNAAPELAGKWELALYPGVVDENGQVQRWTSGAAESNVIFASSNRQQEAWQFIDWWMSTEIQTDFAFMLQTSLGNEYLWNSANLEAIANAPWNRKHKAVIMEQLKWVYETPRVPGGYMAEREMSNAIDKVVAQGTKLQTAIDAAVRNTDREIRRKMEEFGYTENGEYVTPFILPTIEMIEGWLK